MYFEHFSNSLLGVDEKSYPRDFATLVRYHQDIKHLAASYPLPVPFQLDQLNTFLQYHLDFSGRERKTDHLVEALFLSERWAQTWTAQVATFAMTERSTSGLDLFSNQLRG